jgi:hypothetical protein
MGSSDERRREIRMCACVDQRVEDASGPGTTEAHFVRAQLGCGAKEFSRERVGVRGVADTDVADVPTVDPQAFRGVPHRREEHHRPLFVGRSGFGFAPNFGE